MRRRGLVGNLSSRVSQGYGDHDDAVEGPDDGDEFVIRSIEEATHRLALTMAILARWGRPTCGVTPSYQNFLRLLTPRLVQDPETPATQARMSDLE
jgi:hypothetical protein